MNFRFQDDYCVVTESPTATGDIIVPRKVKAGMFKKKHIKCIESRAFYACQNLESISFPDNSEITTIGENAFPKCLKKLALPPKLQYIKENSLFSAESLQEIEVSSSNTHFVDVKKKALINIDNKELLLVCRDVETFVIPKIVKVINSKAFKLCTNIKSISFEENSIIEIINFNIFPPSLTTFTLPKKLKKIEGNDFFSNSLKEISVPSDNDFFGDINKKALLDKVKGVLLFVCADIEDIVIPKVIKAIESYAFILCTKIKSISFEKESVLETIDFDVFPNKLEKLSLPKGLKQIQKLDQPLSHKNMQKNMSVKKSKKYHDFLLSNNLIEIEIPDNNYFCDIDKKALIDKSKQELMLVCKDVENLVIPKIVKVIKKDIFLHCKKLHSITFGENSDMNVLNLKSLPKQLSKFGFPSKCETVSIISSFEKLTEVSFPDDSEIDSFKSFSFLNKLEKFRFPPNIKELNTDWYSYSNKLIEIEVSPKSLYFCDLNKKALLNKDKTELFFVCRDVEQFVVPQTVRVIKNGAFYLNRNSMKIDDNLKIKDISFEENSEYEVAGINIFPKSLKKFALPPKLVEIDESWLSNADNLTEIEVSPQNNYFCDIEKKALFNKEKTVLLYVCRDVEIFIIPSTVKIIKPYAFYNKKGCLTNIKTILFEDESELESVDFNVFSTKLLYFMIPQGLRKVDEKWLFDSENLKEIEVSPKNTHYSDIEKKMIIFNDKKELLFVSGECENLIIPKIVQEINPNAFLFCEQSGKLKTASFDEKSDINIININIFPQSLTKLVLPPKLECIKENTIKGKRKNPKNFLQKCNLKDIEIISDNMHFCDFEKKSLINIDNGELIFVCKDVDSFVIPKMIKKIRSNAFFLCKQIKNISFEDKSEIEKIDSHVFSGLKNLKQKIVLPNTVNSLGDFCFYESGITALECEGPKISIGNNCFDSCDNLITVSFSKALTISIGKNSFNNCKCRLILRKGTPINEKTIGLKDIIYVSEPDNCIGHVIKKQSSLQISPDNKNSKTPKGKYIDRCIIPNALKVKNKTYFICDDKDEKKRYEPYDIESKYKELIRDNLMKQNELESQKEEIESIKLGNELMRQENLILKKMVNSLMEKFNKKKSENTQNIFSTKFFADEDFQELKNVGDIGRGSTANVYKVERTKNISFKETLALKVLNSSDVRDIRNFIREFEVMKEIGKHPCLMNIEGFSYGNSERSPTIVMKYYPTTLQKIFSEKKITLTNTEKVRIIVEMIFGMIYLQEKHNMIHRDLKPENILLSKNKHVRIGDFGLLAIVESVEESLTKGIGTIQYMSPELLNNEKYSKKVDQYAIGKIIYYIIMNGQLPEFKIAEVVTGKLFPIPKEMTKLSQKIIKECCSFNSEERPTFTEILKIMKENKYEILPDVNIEEIEARRMYLEMKESQLLQ